MLATQASPIRSQPRPIPQAPAAVLRRARWWLIFCALRPPLRRLVASLLPLIMLAYLLQLGPALGGWSVGVINLPGLIAAAAIASLLIHGWRLVDCWPTPASQAVLSQVEAASQLHFQPLTGMAASLPTGVAGVTTKLWQLHWQRLAERLSLGQGGWHSGWGHWMRRHGRNLVIQLAIIATVVGLYGWPQALRLPALFGAAASVDFTAWVEAPNYVTMPALALTGSASQSGGGASVAVSGAATKEVSKDAVITVPAGSMLQVRANLSSDRRGLNQDQPRGGQVMRLVAPDLTTAAPLTTPAANRAVQTAQLTIEKAGSYQLWQAGHRLANWRFAVIPPKIPQIDWHPAPNVTPQQRVALPYQLRDDYGVVALELQIVPVDGGDMGGEGAQPIPLPLMGNGRDKMLESKAELDLRDHPLAGRQVLISLRATNLAKAVASTPPFNVTLPRRVFTDPLAQQVDKAMQRLQQKPSDRSAVADQLADVQRQLAQAGDAARIGAYLALQQAEQDLQNKELTRAEGEQLASRTVPLLRQIARGLEEGEVARWQDRFAKARQELAAAMRDPARRAEVPELLRQMQQAWQGYLASTLQQNQAKAPANASADNRPISQSLMSQLSNPMESLLKEMQQAVELGDQARVEQLLQQWQQLASQIKPMPPALAEKIEKADAWAREMQQLIAAQEGLRDKTRTVVDSPPQDKAQDTAQDQAQATAHDNAQDTAKDKGKAKKAESDPAAPSLPTADAQEGVRQQLGQLLAKGAELMKDLPPAAGKADQAMSQAAAALKQQQAKPALSSQEQAIEALKQGQSEAEQALSEQLQQAMQQAGIGGLLTPGSASMDPFGRNTENGSENGNGTTPEGVVTIPDQAEPRFLRQVLDQLRARLQNLPADSPDRPYLERLLGY
ncbi:MAG: DUF4175 family protein [Holosporaceae bacterium]